MIESRQSYSKESGVQFFLAHPVYANAALQSVIIIVIILYAWGEKFRKKLTNDIYRILHRIFRRSVRLLKKWEWTVVKCLFYVILFTFISDVQNSILKIVFYFENTK